MFAKSARSLVAMIGMSAVLFLAGCGGGGGDSASTGASVAKSAVVVGTVVAPKVFADKAAGDPLTVYVLSDPAIKATVGTDGSFTLRGLPEGSFTLVFMQGSTEVGRLTFDQVAPNQQITISVQLVSNEIVLV